MLTGIVRNAWKRLRTYRYRLAVAIVTGAAALRLFLEAQYGVSPPYITFYPAVMLAAILGGIGPSFLATMASAAFVAVFLLEPWGQAGITQLSDLVGLGIFVLMGLLISAMAGALHRIKERERRLIEQALRDSEDRFSLVVAGVKDYAIFMLDPQGRILTWNANAQRIKGWSAEEILGGHYSVFFRKRAGGVGVRRNC